MIQDPAGAMYFMMKTPGGTVNVLRISPNCEMGSDTFVQNVFSLRSSCIYFLLQHQGQFYIMNDQKKISVLEPNKETNMWKLVSTLELPERDTNNIVYADFDEYAISDGVLHTNEKMYFMLNSKAKDNATWASEDIMLENHKHVSGPRYAKESGLIWYMQQYATESEEGQPQQDENELMLTTVGEQSIFKGYSVVMQPLGDLSFIDLLPQRGENNNNFITFINDHNILVNYSGRYLVFDLLGRFVGSVDFTGTNEGFRSNQIKLVNVSESGKFFVFEGPKFLSKEETAAKKER